MSKEKTGESAVPEPSRISYTDAIKRLDEILEDIDQSRVPIDALAERVVEAAALLKRCKGVLTDTEAKVRDVLKDLEEDFGEGEEE